MYNFNTTFFQRWRIHLVVFGAWCWFVHHLATKTTDTALDWSITGPGTKLVKVAPHLVNPNYPWQAAVWLGVVYLFITAVICAYNQFIFQRDIKRVRELYRRIRRGEFEGTGDWT